MRYDCAPMEGLTDRVWRNAQHKYFGGEGDADRYFAPFLSPTQNHVLVPRKLRDVLPEENEGICVVPQLLGKNAEDLVWMMGELKTLGYEEVNINCGCPSGTVVAKGKGAGLLRAPEQLDRLLDGVFSAAPVRVSVKTRLGILEPGEFVRLLEIYNKYPLSELIIHPRVQKDFYKNEVRMSVFDAALSQSKAPVVYNGSVYTPEGVRAFEAAHPACGGVMLGRGLAADPALIRKLRGGPPADRETLRNFMSELYDAYTELFGHRNNAIRRMKGVWTYVICLFDENEKLAKTLRRLDGGREYESAVAQVFETLSLRPDAKDVR